MQSIHRSGVLTRLASRRGRGIQLALVAFITYAITRISDGRSQLPQNSTLDSRGSDSSSSGRNGYVSVRTVTNEAFPLIERDQMDRKAQSVVTGPPLPVFNLSACMEEPPVPPAQQFMTTDMFLGGNPTRLRLETALISEQRPHEKDITVVVTFDLGRLYMLEGLCLTWGGAISAAVYQSVVDGPARVRGVGNDEALRDAKYRVTDFHARVTEQRTCMLDMTLFSEVLAANDPDIKDLFPVNALRNRAMLMTRTALVLVLDGDLLPQANMRVKLAAGTARGDALLNGATAREYHVLPAFDTQYTELAYSIARGNKAAAVAAFSDGTIVRFGAKGSRFPQGCTDYERWKTAVEQYPVVYCNRYEPWGIVAREHSPWFDSRFRGYGRNKIMYASALNASGFEFVIDPDAFVIHRPHPRSTAQRVFDNDQDRRVHDYIMAMWSQQADSGNFEAVVDETALRCKQQLPWWKGVAMHVGHSRVAGLRGNGTTLESGHRLRQ